MNRVTDFPLVTIMIPTYNQENYISEAIESALNQDYPNLEIIVSDDNSKDNTSDVLKKYLEDSRIVYNKNENNLGRVGNYHHTLYNLATGDWVVNLDGDDYFTNNHFISDAMQKVLEQNDVVCYFGRKYLSGNLKSYPKADDRDYYVFNGKDYFLNYFNIGGFSHARTLYKRSEALKDHKCYTFKGIQSDFHGIIRYSINGNIILSYDNSLYWRQHDNNATISVNPKEKYKSERKCQFEIINDLADVLTVEERKKWLHSGKNWAKYRYIQDCIIHIRSYKSILLALKYYKFNRSKTIILIKVILRYIGFKIKI